MAGVVSGQGTTFDLPNYTGELFQLTPSDTPFLSAIGGLTGGISVQSTEFEWQTYDLRNAAQNTKVEGAAAPTAEERVRANVTNVVEIHQETVEVTYTKSAATGLKSGSNNALANPVNDELGWQVAQMLKQIARDVEFSFLNGTFVKPVDNGTARKTRGLIEAIATNVSAQVAGTALTDVILLDLMQDVYDNGGIMESETATIIVNSFQKRQLTKLFVTDANYREMSRNLGGVNVQTIETDFGRLNIMLNRHMPADTLVVCSLEQCAPVFLEIPGKGFLFQESLAKVGASDKTMIYGEIGLRYGNERTHGKITGLKTTV